MKQANKRAGLREIYAAAVSVALIAGVLVMALVAEFSSFAWFASSSRVEAGGLQVYTEMSGTCEEIKYYRCTSTLLETVDGKKTNHYLFSYADSALDFENGNTVERSSFNTPISMLPYSDLSGNCQVLIEVRMGGAGKYSIEANTSATEYLGDIFATAVSNGVFNVMPQDLPLSSVVHFAILTAPQKDTEEQVFSIYESDIEPIDVSFVKLDSSGNISFANAFEGLENNRYEFEVGADGLFYIFVDYYRPAVEDLMLKTDDYVTAAKKKDPAYNTIVFGETNLLFNTDFFFAVREVNP